MPEDSSSSTSVGSTKVLMQHIFQPLSHLITSLGLDWVSSPPPPSKAVWHWQMTSSLPSMVHTKHGQYTERRQDTMRQISAAEIMQAKGNFSHNGGFAYGLQTEKTIVPCQPACLGGKLGWFGMGMKSRKVRGDYYWPRGKISSQSLRWGLWVVFRLIIQIKKKTKTFFTQIMT